MLKKNKFAIQILDNAISEFIYFYLFPSSKMKKERSEKSRKNSKNKDYPILIHTLARVFTTPRLIPYLNMLIMSPSGMKKAPRFWSAFRTILIVKPSDEFQILQILCFISVRNTFRNFPITGNVLVEMNKVLIVYRI